MDNDTPTPGPQESHPPFMSERNEEGAAGVHSGMDDTTIPADEATPTDPPVDDDTTNQAPVPPEASPEDASGGISADTGEMAVTDEVLRTEFMYDDPYALVGAAQSAPPGDDHPPAVPPVSAPFATPSAPQPRKERTGLVFFFGALAAAVLGALITVGILAMTGTFDDPIAAPIPTTVPTTVAAAPIITEITNEIGSAVNPTAIAVKVLPSIVTVNVFEDGPGDGDPRDRIITGSGSGVVMSTEGYLITNHHVVEGATSYSVTFEDGRTYEADLVGSDSLTDLAVLRITAEGLKPIVFGSTGDLAVGDPAVAVGNPLGQEGGSSISAGIISAFNRRVDFADSSTLHGMIQTDAAINSGSSGGALVDAEGSLIGITSAIGVSTAGPEGIGYAIPIELVDRITAELIETGDVIHPFLGVRIQTFFGLAADGAIVPSGVEVESIDGTVSAAQDAGIEVGDVVVDIAGRRIETLSDLILSVRLYRVGDIVTFTIERGAETLEVDVTMGQRPEGV